MTNTSPLWQEIVDLTQQMQLHLVDENWQQLVFMQQQRETLLADFFSQGVSASQFDDIQQLLNVNESMSEKLAKNRSTLTQQFKKILLGKSGINAYQQVSYHK